MSENLVREKSLGFEKFGIGKKVSVSVSVKILVSSFSGFSAPVSYIDCVPEIVSIVSMLKVFEIISRICCYVSEPACHVCHVCYW